MATCAFAPTYLLDGPATVTNFGQRVSNAGDIDQDGIDDWFVYASNVIQGSTVFYWGKSFLYSGRTRALLWEQQGSTPTSFLGFSSGGTGDLNADGLNDWFVGEPGLPPLVAPSSPFTPRPSGGMHFVLGPASNPTDILVRAPAGCMSFGSAAARVGDINGDGHDEIAVCSPGLSYYYFPEYPGRVHLYSYLGGTFRPLWTRAETVHPSLASYFGYCVAGIGDVNGDGCPDVAVGAPTERNSAGSPGGAVHVLSGRNGNTIYSLYSPPTPPFPSQIAYFGASIAGVGDFDGDGFPDLLVGSPRYSGSSSAFNAGRACLFSGRTGTLLKTWYGEAYEDSFGESVASVGDYDGDGLPDFAIGAPGHGDHRQGRISIYSIRTGNRLDAYTGGAHGSSLGHSIAGAGDPDQNGLSNLIYGARENGEFGRAYISGQ